MLKDIILDFDGVVLESVDCKTAAFEDLFKPYGAEVCQKVVDHHERNGGMSRFEKIPFYFENFIGKSITHAEIDCFSKKFSDLILSKVISSEFVPGIRTFLNDNSTDVSFWILTATPQKEIEHICNALDITKCFKGIIGSPPRKAISLESLLSAGAISLNSSVFIGDSLNDLDASIEARIRFVLRETSQNISYFKGYKGKRIQDFKELTISKLETI